MAQKHGFIMFSPNSLVASAPKVTRLCRKSPTSVSIDWTPPDPLGHTTGYSITYYSSVGTANTPNYTVIPVLGGLLTNSYLLSRLRDGGSYYVSVEGVSEHFCSGREQSVVHLLDIGGDGVMCEDSAVGDGGEVGVEGGCEGGSGEVGEGRASVEGEGENLAVVVGLVGFILGGVAGGVATGCLAICIYRTRGRRSSNK